MRRPAAFLFDLDGTLVDTVALRVRGWRQAFAEAGMSAGDELLDREDQRRWARHVVEQGEARSRRHRGEHGGGHLV